MEMKIQSVNAEKFKRVCESIKWKCNGVLMHLYFDVYRDGNFERHLCFVVENMTFIKLNDKCVFQYNSVPCAAMHAHFTRKLHDLHMKQYRDSEKSLPKPYYPQCDMFYDMCVLTKGGF